MGMLVVTRRIQEKVRIGDTVSITIFGMERGQVKLGIDAPKSVTVDREEVWERKQAERKRQAGMVAPVSGTSANTAET